MDQHRGRSDDAEAAGLRIVRRLAITPPGRWITRHHLHRLDIAMHRRTGGRHTLTSMVTGLPIAMVTSTGARSGQQRRSPLIGLPTEDGVAVIGSNYGGAHHPGWVHNLRADPRGSVTIEDESWDFVAVEVEGGRRAAIWHRAVDVWPGYALYEDLAAPRHIPVFDLTRT